MSCLSCVEISSFLSFNSSFNLFLGSCHRFHFLFTLAMSGSLFLGFLFSVTLFNLFLGSCQRSLLSYLSAVVKFFFYIFHSGLSTVSSFLSFSCFNRWTINEFLIFGKLSTVSSFLSLSRCQVLLFVNLVIDLVSTVGSLLSSPVLSN